MKIKKQNRNFPFRMWIGLTDLNEEGVWRWDSGAKATYLPWTQRKRNSFPGSQDCVVMDFTWFGNNGKWNKFWCSARGFYSNWSVGAICELNQITISDDKKIDEPERLEQETAVSWDDK